VRQTLLSLTLALWSASTLAQSSVEREPGLREVAPSWHAFTGARLVLAPGQVVANGTLLVKDGRIVAAGADVKLPAGARVWPMAGRSIYAGFIELSSAVGVPESLRERPAAPPADPFASPWEGAGNRSTARSPAPLVARSLASRNNMLRAEQQVATQLDIKPEALQALRRLGFTSALAAPSYGVLRGQGALLALRQSTDPKSLVLAAAPSQHLGLDLNGFGQYPSSLMGAIALARQSLLDARWYGTQTTASPHAGLAALQAPLNGQQLLVAAARDEQDLQRWLQLRDEFSLQRRFLLQGSGFEYRQLAVLTQAKPELLLPLNFPEAPELSGDAGQQVPLNQLQHWEAAPSNAAWLQQAGLRFALTSAGLSKPEQQFWARLRQAVGRGLSPDAALAALTTTPAALLGESARLGSLAPGKLAHAVVYSGDPFVDAQAEPLLSVVGDQVHTHPAWHQTDPRGQWQLADGSNLVVAGSLNKPSAKWNDKACTLALEGAQWQLGCSGWRVTAEQRQGASGLELSGSFQAGPGQSLQPWQAQRTQPHSAEAPKASADAHPPAPDGRYPFGAYAQQPLAAGSTLLRGATVWTQGAAGQLAETDVLLHQGRITAIGKALPLPAGAQEVDARGQHLTPGLIDAHSHIAMSRGVNEGSDSITAEVRAADVLDATDINLYRQLAGGVTSANLLHGSANAIGGQSAVIKLRWGERAPALLFKEATPSIKFALGENVKQSNFGGGDRYPQTRMGVEQLLLDAFAQARDYSAQPAATRRRDLRLETLAELLAGTRAIHIHSYRADEILMFSRLAQQQGLKVAAFQHVLEGYKVAKEIAALGAGASTFIDWWGFKAESFDGVVGNPALLTRAGVLTSLNSDDAELARRLNTEAAKAVKVGGLSPQEALALVTINPAKQLGVDKLVGSIEVGKQADVVLWNGPPLSSFSRVQSTWVDGVRRFDRQQDALLRLRDAQERERLLKRLAQAPKPDSRSSDAVSPLQALLEHARALARVAHAEYHDGQAAHECTEEHTQ